jgi:cytochrome c oxidase subunit 2
VSATSEGAAVREPRHFRRMFALWAIASAVADPLFYFVVGPHVPPGAMTNTASGQQFDFNVLFLMALPVVLAVWIYIGYALIHWRASRAGSEGDVLAADIAVTRRKSYLIQAGWITLTSLIVMGVFIFGLVELIVPAGAGGGEGPNPIWNPTSHNVLDVQVIGQQWRWTFRYPTFGGFESPDLVLPDNTTIAFHVTSLDVIHSFWAYQLGVKADADPSMDNIAYTTTNQTGTFLYECAELCGIWHGSMWSNGKVVTPSQFETWAKSEETTLAASTKLLPAFAWTYVPDANGADGGYYPDTNDPYSNVEQYGAATPAKGKS